MSTTIESVNTSTINEVEKPKAKRGRKSKYNTDEERIDARRRQQREYRHRKKEELELLRKLYAESQKQAKSVPAEGESKVLIPESDSL